MNKATQTITFKPLSASVTYGANPLALSATATSGLSVTFSATGPATVNGNMLSFTGAGTVAVTASQPGDSNHSAAVPISTTVTVSKGASKAGLAASSSSGVYGSSITLTATVTGAGVSPSGVVTFRSGTVSLRTGTLSSGVAKLATNALPAGNDSIIAS